MDKLSNFVSTVKDSDFLHEQASSGASDKAIKCLAVIGLFATAKALWRPVRSYLMGEEKVEEIKTSKRGEHI